MPSRIFQPSTILIFAPNNLISNMEMRAFSGVEHKLIYMHLDINKLTHLPSALTELSALRNLHLVFNPLISLDATVLANLSSTLVDVSISVDRFASFPSDISRLTKLEALVIFDITSNVLHYSIISRFPNSLVYLDLSFANSDSFHIFVCRMASQRNLQCNYSPKLETYTFHI